MTPNGKSRPSDALAASWDARLRAHDCTPAEREEFAQWLKEDVRNQESFDQLQAALALLRKAADHPRLRGMSESARMIERRSARLRVLRYAAIAASLGVVAIATLWMIPRPVPFAAGSSAAVTAIANARGTQSWNTGAGERRIITLQDGSSVTMGPSSRLQAEWPAGERRIHLFAGQALFHVSKDPTRPFVVTAGQRTVTALGTMFDVRLSPGALRVTLVEGRVAVKPLRVSKSQPVVELTPGEQFEVVAGDLPTVHRVDAAAESAWADGQVIFTDAPLPRAVAEMNRYSEQQIVAAPDLAKFRVNGMFLAGDQAGFVAAITSYYPLSARKDAHNRILLELNPPAHR